jgi:colicin import membrane protein
MRCIVTVRVAPGGQVIAATVTQSSGNPAFDRSAESAVYKATPLPVPADKGLFEAHFREFNFEFKPEG